MIKWCSRSLFSARDVDSFGRDCVFPRLRPMIRHRLCAYRLARFFIFRGRVVVLVHLCPGWIHSDGERWWASHSGGSLVESIYVERLEKTTQLFRLFCLFLLFNDVYNIPSRFLMDRVRKAFEHPLLILNRRRCVYPFQMLRPSLHLSMWDFFDLIW